MFGKRFLTPTALLAAAGSLVALLAACSGDDAPAPPSQGTTTSTSSGSGGSSSAATTGSGGAGGSATTTTPIGATCVTDADCEGGRCMVPTVDEPVFGGGIAGGYCTRDCASDADCGASAKCLAGGTGQTCVERCALGPALGGVGDALDAAKCHGREDVGCAPAADGDAVCLPTCGSDSQCDGRACNRRLGVCLAGGATGKPDGALCTAEPDLCQGLCLVFESGAAKCSRNCVLGGKLDSLDCGGKLDGVCLHAPTGRGAGDRGFCASSCAAHDDCQNPAFWCTPVTGVTEDLVPFGYCEEASACDGGAACATGVCTLTQYGSFCLDAAFPLGSAGP